MCSDHALEASHRRSWKIFEVTVDAANLTPQFLTVALVPPPQPIRNQQSLRELFAELSIKFQLDAFSKTPDGGALFSNPGLLRFVTISPPLRRVQFNVDTTASRTLEEILAILELAHQKFPVEQYLIFNADMICHAPVTGETAIDLVESKVFKNRDALDALGVGRVASGVRAILKGTGQIVVIVEPLLADPGKLYVQRQEGVQGAFQLSDVRARMNAFLKVYDSQLKGFMTALLEG